MSLILTTRENLEDRSLVHYRTKGSKNGVRQYQYEGGSLTPLGRIHYGVGQAKKAVAEEVKGYIKTATSKNSKEKAEAKTELYKNRLERKKDKAVHDTHLGKDDRVEKDIKKAAEFDEKVNKYLEKQKHIEEREKKNNRSNAEIRKDVEARIKQINKSKKNIGKKTVDDIKEKVEPKKEVEKLSRQDEIDEIRSLTDEELNKRIARLQKEKTYSDLVNQRSEYEKSPFRLKAEKIVNGFVENYARKALNMVGDKALNKMFNKQLNRSNDQNHGQNNQPKQNTSSKPNNPNKPNTSGYGAGNRFGKQQKNQIKTMAKAGKSLADIAKALGTTEDRVKGYMASAGITINQKNNTPTKTSVWTFGKGKVTHQRKST